MSAKKSYINIINITISQQDLLEMWAVLIIF